MTIKGIVAVSLAAVSLAGCAGSATRVSNHSQTAWVIEVTKQRDALDSAGYLLPDAPHYQPVPPGRTLAVDDAGEANAPGYGVVLLDANCHEVRTLDYPLDNGGVITIAADGSTTFQPGLTATTQDVADVTAMLATCTGTP